MIDILLEASLRSLVVGGCVSLVLHGVGVRTGATRHAALTAVLLAMLVSPLMVVWRPALPVSLPALAVANPLTAGPAAPAADESPVVSSMRTADERFIRSSPSSDAPAAQVTTAAAPPTGVEHDRNWSDVALAIWLVGVIVGTLRTAGGWHRFRLFTASCVPVTSARVGQFTGTRVVESPMAVAPVVFGILRPCIVLPSSWSTWTDADLRATLVHETAHVRRRDMVVALAGRVNRTVYWFHPLAWWLERALATSAEQACDDEVVRGRGDERAYAELLVRCASAVSAARRRLLWPTVGIGGRGTLEARIDRLLMGEGRRPTPRHRAVVLALGCAAVITAGLACQQQPAPLRPEPEREVAWRAREDQMRQWQTAASMTVGQVEAMEARAVAAPTDLESAIALLTFYQQRGQAEFGWNGMLARRRPHLLRVVEHHPEADAAARRIIRSHDPEGYAQVRAVWEAHVSKPDASTAVLANAASFFSVAEKPLAEQLLLRAQTLEADGPHPRRRDGIYYAPWAERLGEMYALGILGSSDALEGNVVREVDPDAARGPFAAHARAVLDATEDTSLVVAAGRLLVRNAPRIASPLGFDVAALGRAYLERAIALDPDLHAPRMLLMNEDSRRRHLRVPALLGGAEVDPESALDALPETERLEVFADLTNYSFIGAGGVFRQREDAGEAHARARRVAEAALQLAERHPTSPNAGLVTHNANIALGLFAIREGDRRQALAHLRAAAASPGSPELTWMPTISHFGLVHALLDAGEYDAVASYLDRLAELNRVAQHAGATRLVRFAKGACPRVTS